MDTSASSAVPGPTAPPGAETKRGAVPGPVRALRRLVLDILFIGSGLVVLIPALPLLAFMLAPTVDAGMSGILLFASPLVLAIGIFPLFALSFLLAAFSRWRVNFWARDRGWRMPGVPLPRPRSWSDAFHLLLNGRRWLDAVFELVVAPVMRGSWLLGLMAWCFPIALGISLIRESAVNPPPEAVYTLTYQLTFWLSSQAFWNPAPTALPGTAAEWVTADIVLASVMVLGFLLTLPMALRIMAMIEARVTVLALGDERGPISLHGEASSPPVRSFSMTGWVSVQALVFGTVLVPFQLLGTLAPLGGLQFGTDEAGTLISMLVACAATILLIASVPMAGWRPRTAAVLVMLGLLIAIIAPIVSHLAMRSEPDLWLYTGPDSLIWPFGFGTAGALGGILYLQFFAGRFRLGTTTLTASLGVAVAATVVWRVVFGGGLERPVLVMVLTTAGLLVLVIAGFLVNLFITNQAALAEQRARSRAAERARAESEAARIRSDAARARSEAARTDLMERSRIARELHDVVAHSMSVISVQASTAQYRLPAKTASGEMLDPAVAAEFEQIAANARQALGEMRGLLGLLRGSANGAAAGVDGGGDGATHGSAPGAAAGVDGGGDGAARGTVSPDGTAGAAQQSPLMAPQPDLSDLDALVQRTRDAGVSVDLDWVGDWGPSGAGDPNGSDGASGTAEGVAGGAPALAPTVQLVLFRAVQEGLSNALRHAPGSAVTVTMRRTPPGSGVAGSRVEASGVDGSGAAGARIEGSGVAGPRVEGPGADGDEPFRANDAGTPVAGTVEAVVVNGPAADDHAQPAPGAGLGLRGVRERVGALGGEVSEGPLEDGGFRLGVRVPV